MTPSPDISDINAILQEDAQDTTWMDEMSDWHDRQLQERHGNEPPLH